MLYNRYYTEVSRSVRRLVLLVISQATWAVDKQTEKARNNGH